jgi:hypothetical protein
MIDFWLLAERDLREKPNIPNLQLCPDRKTMRFGADGLAGDDLIAIVLGLLGGRRYWLFLGLAAAPSVEPRWAV